MKKMDLALIEETKYHIFNMICDYEDYNDETDISKETYEKLKNINDSDIEKIVNKILNNSNVWEYIHNIIENELESECE